MFFRKLSVITSCHERFTMDLQVAAVLICPACENEIITGLDLEVVSLILVLGGRTKSAEQFSFDKI